jgi:hypothetical protein
MASIKMINEDEATGKTKEISRILSKRSELILFPTCTRSWLPNQVI